ncbi:hypothetical protein C1H46_013434 [Malus baccata]|uniref:Uncharacterized protein n=1 Tax=Malus baccata TaxID=106549 RepID=A0A540MQ38_MALBA|nr:hypothetical protein C1H46_013434 [Malus baccata]
MVALQVSQVPVSRRFRCHSSNPPSRQSPTRRLHTLASDLRSGLSFPWLSEGHQGLEAHNATGGTNLYYSIMVCNHSEITREGKNRIEILYGNLMENNKNKNSQSSMSNTFSPSELRLPGGFPQFSSNANQGWTRFGSVRF